MWADVYSDHHLVIATIRLKLCNVVNQQSQQRKHTDVTKLKYQKHQQSICSWAEKSVQSVSTPNGTKIKSIYVETATNILNKSYKEWLRPGTWQLKAKTLSINLPRLTLTCPKKEDMPLKALKNGKAWSIEKNPCWDAKGLSRHPNKDIYRSFSINMGGGYYTWWKATSRSVTALSLPSNSCGQNQLNYQHQAEKRTSWIQKRKRMCRCFWEQISICSQKHHRTMPGMELPTLHQFHWLDRLHCESYGGS